jgi:hypothetical protein
MLLFLNIISLYIEVLVSSFHQPLKTSSIKLFGLLLEPGGDFPFYSFIVGKMFSRKMMSRRAEQMEVAWSNAVETSCVVCQKKKFKVTPSSRKVMLTVFWDHEGILPTTFRPQGQTINADSYCDILRKLHKAIQWKRPGLLSKGVLPTTKL